jgi:hypothetical protein
MHFLRFTYTNKIAVSFVVIYLQKKITLRRILFLSVLLFPLLGLCQLGGSYVYEFLSVPISPRSAALGGSAMAINDGDISLAFENPSLLTPSTSGKLAIQYLNYVSDINYGSVSYAKNWNKLGTFGVGLLYYNGGDFQAADENGSITGTFGVSEWALNFAYNKSFDSILSIGAIIKPVFSNLESYKSFGLVMDVGVSYNSKDQLFTAALLLKNMGAQITKYIDESGNVPFDLQVGIATKLAHAPFRFSIVAHHLNKPKLSYQQTNYPEPTNVEQTYEETESLSFLEETLNHMIIGVEFVPTKSFFLRGGFNYLRRQELKLGDSPGMAGFSWGFGFRIKRFNLSYANARYNQAAASNQFAITTRLSDFFN